MIINIIKILQEEYSNLIGLKITMNILYENSEKKEENNGNIIIYKIDEKVINDIIKKNNKFNIGNIIEESSEIKENDKCLIF